MERAAKVAHFTRVCPQSPRLARRVPRPRVGLRSGPLSKLQTFFQETSPNFQSAKFSLIMLIWPNSIPILAFGNLEKKENRQGGMGEDGKVKSCWNPLIKSTTAGRGSGKWWQ